MKLKDKIQQVLIARNFWRTEAIPKLPQRENQEQMYMLDEIAGLREFLYLASRCVVSKNVWRTNKPKLEQQNTNVANEMSPVREITAFKYKREQSS